MGEWMGKITLCERGRRGWVDRKLPGEAICRRSAAARATAGSVYVGRGRHGQCSHTVHCCAR